MRFMRQEYKEDGEIFDIVTNKNVWIKSIYSGIIPVYVRCIEEDSESFVNLVFAWFVDNYDPGEFAYYFVNWHPYRVRLNGYETDTPRGFINTMLYSDIPFNWYDDIDGLKLWKPVEVMTHSEMQSALSRYIDLNIAEDVLEPWGCNELSDLEDIFLGNCAHTIGNGY